MVEIKNNARTYIINQDTYEYTYNVKERKWVLRMYNLEYPQGKFVAMNGYLDNILDKIPN